MFFFFSIIGTGVEKVGKVRIIKEVEWGAIYLLFHPAKKIDFILYSIANELLSFVRNSNGKKKMGL